MPSPLISHLVGTAALLGAALLILSAFSYSYFMAYMSSVNLMLNEVAESVAREIVEIVSVQTLGGGNYTYMYLTVPDTLHGQPYLITVQDVEENKLLVSASLQIYRQVRVVVTPNFGRNPVHAVSGTLVVPSSQLQVSDKILLPLPPGYKPAVVTFRSCSCSGEASRGACSPLDEKICVGFAAVGVGG